MNTGEDMHLNFEPLYVQIKEKMLALIEEKTYKFGEKLPAEPELARIFGVSRPTIREALRALAQEGVVIIRHGLGTFVAGGQAYVKSDLEELTSITRAIRQRGWNPGTTKAVMREEMADEELAERLQMSSPGPVIHIERVRTADSVPVFYSVHKIVKERAGEKVLRWNMDGSFLEFLEKECGIHTLYAVTAILPVPNPKEVTGKMGIPCDVPVLLLDQIHYDVNNKPVFRSYDHYRTDIFKFHVVRRMKRR